MRAWGLPPKFALKKSICALDGLPRRIVKATMRPGCLAVKRPVPALPPVVTWNAVVRVTAWQGSAGQDGVGSDASDLPISMIWADAAAGNASAAAEHAPRIRGAKRRIVVIQHHQPA